MTLIEVLITLTVISVVLAMSAPSVVRTMEQAHADMVGANLRAIWIAERAYWLDHRVYATDLATLQTAGLLDPSIVAGSRYTYAISNADGSHFRAVATRVGSGVWSGQLAIDETGAISGAVTNARSNYQITPGFE